VNPGGDDHRGLHVSLRVPLAWRAMSAGEADGILQRTAMVLQLLNLQGESSPLPEAGEEARQAWRHLDRKLDVIIAMLGLLLAQGGEGGEVVPSRLDPRGIEWAARTGPEAGRPVVVRLQLPGAPALELPGTAQPAADGRWRVAFDAWPEAVAEQLEKWIFRQHRQAVARARQKTPPS